MQAVPAPASVMTAVHVVVEVVESGAGACTMQVFEHSGISGIPGIPITTLAEPLSPKLLQSELGQSELQ